MRKETFMEFHTNLMGYDIYEGSKWIPKFVCYWCNIHSDDILLNRTKYKAIEK